MNGETGSGSEDLGTDQTARLEELLDDDREQHFDGEAEGHGEASLGEQGESVDDREPHGEPEAAPVVAVPTPPVTGDEAVDDAMMRLAESQAGSFAERIEAGEHAHRSLQSRLGGLGGA
ncbi:hypothetical protein [Terrabacter carboxydivorans]|uniref:Uncharacterized protein n=1 Tax=Terrabacter carboxydivorans TaxID=619730 RepID=A0ABP5YJX7_9MICO